MKTTLLVLFTLLLRYSFSQQTFTNGVNTIVIQANVLAHETCAGNCDGVADVIVTGGSGNYIFDWSSTGGTSQIESNLCPGTHLVVVTDITFNIVCTDMVIINPSAGIPITTVVNSTINPSCFATCDGIISYASTGGVPPLTHTLNGAPVSNTTITGLCAGTYNLETTDANGCTMSNSVLIQDPTELNLTIDLIQNESAAGANDGFINTSVIGGTSPYLFTINGGTPVTSNNFTGLTAGTYNICVTDQNNCTSCENTVLMLGQAACGNLIDSLEIHDNLCSSADQGWAVVHSNTNNLTYNWNPTPCNGHSDTALALPAGTNCVTITDLFGCTLDTCFSLTAPPLITATDSINHCTSLFDCDGSNSITVTGGTPPYTLIHYVQSGGAWNIIPNESGLLIDSLCPGTYGYNIVQDTSYCSSNPCSVICTDTTCNGTSDTTTTFEPDYQYDINTCTLSLTGSSTPENACDEDGTVTLIGDCGVPPYTFGGLGTMSVNNNIATFTDVPSGNHIYSITDSDGNSVTVTVGVSVINELSASVNFLIEPTCYYTCDGYIEYTITGGTPPYAVNGTAGNTASGICIGMSVLIQDSNGCTFTHVPPFNQTNPIQIMPSVSNANCFGHCDGLIDVSQTFGGFPPYSYHLQAPGGTMSNNNGLFTGLCAGTYIIEVIDNNVCSEFMTFTISEPTQIVTNVSTTDASCSGVCNGSILATSAGGIPPYTYELYDNLNNIVPQNNLCAGAYILVTTDGNGCTTQNNIVINEPTQITSFVGTMDVTCNGNCDGSAVITTTGGTFPYIYDFNGSGNSSNVTYLGLCAGIYTVTTTDANGCVIVNTALINEPAPLILSGISTNASSSGASDGTASVVASGGTPGYVYELNGTTNSTGVFNNLPIGVYTICVTDANGCQTCTAITVSYNGACTLTSTGVVSNVTCNGACDGSIAVSTTGGTGSITYAWAPNPPNGQGTNTVSGLCAGTYILSIMDANACTETLTFIITEPTALSLTGIGTDLTCNGNCDGEIILTANGGTPPYHYSVDCGVTFSNQPIFTGLCAGTYCTAVMDANGCMQIYTILLNEPTAIIANATSTNISDSLNCDGTLIGSATGGTGILNYLWTDCNTGNGIGTTATWSNVCAGSYYLTVFDQNGCSDSTACIEIIDSTQITPCNIQLTANITNVSCFGLCDGSIDLTVANGAAPITHIWSHGATTENVDDLCAGTYCVEVIDANGCSDTACYVITEPTQIISTSIPTFATCPTCQDAEINTTATGGTGALTITVYDPTGTFVLGTGSNVSGLFAGVYSVCVTDANGCETCELITIGFNVGIQELNFITNLFPNPTSGNVTLVNDINREFKLSLYDVSGKLFRKYENINSSEFKIPLEELHLDKGIYYINIETNLGNKTLKLIKN